MPRAISAKAGTGVKKFKPPDDKPPPSAQSNMTDPDASLMRKNKGSEYRQSYNAQAAVSTDGSQLILGNQVSTCAADGGELVADVDAVLSPTDC